MIKGKKAVRLVVPWFLEPLRTYFPEPVEPEPVKEVERNCVDCNCSIIGAQGKRLRCDSCKAYRSAHRVPFCPPEVLSPEVEAMWSDESFWE